MSSIRNLTLLGQSVWLDFIDRGFMESGELKRLVDEGVRGVTSNPSIFEKAIVGTSQYDIAVDRLLDQNDLDPTTLYEKLAIQDIAQAADILYPTYQELRGGDGFVSLEVSPYLASDTEGTIREARRLWDALGRRPNVMIKVPATPEGLPAIRRLTSDGINVNITLLFSTNMYRRVAEAYFGGLEDRQAAGHGIEGISSVASFFVSRIDTAVDKKLNDKISRISAPSERKELSRLLGKVAIANAKIAYEYYQTLYAGSRWQALERAGGRKQRLLWGSTSTKNPDYSDVLYVEELVGPETINTLPLETLRAFRDHGYALPTLTHDVRGAHKILETLAEEGFDLEEITQQVLREGIEKFAEPFGKLLKSLSEKRVRSLRSKAAA